jgi:hypothetical protein
MRSEHDSLFGIRPLLKTKSSEGKAKIGAAETKHERWAVDQMRD